VVFLFSANRAQLRGPVFRALADLQGNVAASEGSRHGVFGELRHLFSIEAGTLTKIGFVLVAYAALEGAEAIGLWYQRRWAEYLTLVATAALLPLEIYELAKTLSPLKLLTFALNLAVVVYLLFAKRLFGLRGGAAEEERVRERDAGWPAIDRATPGDLPVAT
jgi:uncharacterized membrane protein (DUF2068 family)